MASGFTLTSIKKITIVERASFTVPATFSASCGSATTKTFTVANDYGTPNVTNYTWQLGANNGWLYSGVAAPSTISTGTTASITLTTDCGKKQRNVYVNVTAGGQLWTSNASTPSYSFPTMTISGNAGVCSGAQNYTVAALPCNGTIAWSINPTGPVTLSHSGNQGTLTYVSPGRTILTANVTGCGTAAAPISKSIEVGVPLAASEIDPYGSGYEGTGCIDFGIGGRRPSRAEAIFSYTPSQVEWQLGPYITSTSSGGSNPFILGPAGIDIPINISSSMSTSYLRVRSVNACGYSGATFVNFSRCSGFAPEEPGESINVSPNPANTVLKISTSSGTDMSRIQVVDKLGNVRKDAYLGKGVKQQTIDVTKFQNAFILLRYSTARNG